MGMCVGACESASVLRVSVGGSHVSILGVVQCVCICKCASDNSMIACFECYWEHVMLDWVTTYSKKSGSVSANIATMSARSVSVRCGSNFVKKLPASAGLFLMARRTKNAGSDVANSPSFLNSGAISVAEIALEWNQVLLQFLDKKDKKKCTQRFV